MFRITREIKRYRMVNCVKVFICAIGVLVAFQHCTSDQSPPPKASDLDTVRDPCSNTKMLSFKQDIKPIFEKNCAKSGCHKKVGNASYAFVDYRGISNGVLNGRVIGAIKHKDGFYNMPANRSEPLPDTTICKIERWADSGAPNN